jgi:hypothetical protein
MIGNVSYSLRHQIIYPQFITYNIDFKFTSIDYICTRIIDKPGAAELFFEAGIWVRKQNFFIFLKFFQGVPIKK